MNTISPTHLQNKKVLKELNISFGVNIDNPLSYQDVINWFMLNHIYIVTFPFWNKTNDLPKKFNTRVFNKNGEFDEVSANTYHTSLNKGIEKAVEQLKNSILC